jgi:hypothetical protein
MSLITEESEECQDNGEEPGPKETNINTKFKSGWFKSDAVEIVPDAKFPLLNVEATA